MSILDWVFISLISATLLFLFFGAINLISLINNKKKYNQLKRKRPKNKQKQKKIKRVLSKLKKQQKKNTRHSIVLIMLAIITLSSGMYARYYQQTNLEADDANAIVQSYFLVGEIEKELTNIAAGSDPGKVNERLAEMSSLLITYGNKNAFNGLSAEGQKKLNRYYTLVREFGVNLSGRTIEKLNNVAYIETCLADIQKIKKNQKQLFEVFKVNETALKQKK